MYDLQTNYPNTPYTTASGLPAGATISSGGCCPTSVGNILRNFLKIQEATTKEVCKIAISSGARYDGGTDCVQLLAACKKKWNNFEYKKCTSDTEMKEHIQNGGRAIAHTPGSSGGATGLFSSGGHFVAIIGSSGSKLKVADPYWYSNKWTANSTRSTHISITSVKGVVIADYSAVAAACDYYFLISKVKKISIKPPEYKVGNTYSLQTDLKLRSSAAKGGGNVLKKANLLAYTQKCCANNTDAILKAGTEITCKAIQIGSDGSVFVKSSSGWLLAWNKKTKAINIC